MAAARTKKGKGGSRKTERTRTVARSAKKKGAAGGGGAWKRWAPVMDFVGLLASFFVILALLSHSEFDPGFSRSSSAEIVHNWGGVIGAWTADIAYQLFGWAAWSFLLAPLVFIRRLAGRAPTGWSGRIGLVVSVLGLSTGLALAIPHAPECLYPPGGVVGMLAAAGLEEAVGGPGAWLVVLGVFSAAATLAIGVDWQAGAERCLQLLEAAWSSLLAALAAGGRALGDAAGRGLRFCAALLWAGVKHALLAPWWGLRALLSLPGRAWRMMAEGRAARREAALEAGEHLPIDADIVEEDSLPPVSVAEPAAPRTEVPVYTDAPPREPIAARPGDRPTMVGARELVEAEWEPTEHGVSTWPDNEGTDFWDPAWRGSTQGNDDERASLAAGAGAVPSDGARVSRAEVIVEVDAYEAPSVYDAPDAGSVQRPPPPDLVDEPVPSSVHEELPPEEDALVPPESQHSPLSNPEGVALRPGCLESGGNDLAGQVVVPSLPEELFELPDLGLLDRHSRSVAAYDEEGLRRLAGSLEEKLSSFGIKGQVTAIRPGPVVTIFEYLPGPGVKISKIAGLQDDIAMAMRAIRVRIVAPIPGKGVVGIEIPATDRQTVWIRDMLASEEFRKGNQALPLVLGKSVDGKPVIGDLAKMPHLLIGGSTGSGKSVGVNAMLASLLYTRTPAELRLILVDPKIVEFELYKDIPHLLHPVVTEVKLANAALKWAVEEMERRYRLMKRWGTRNIRSLNSRIEEELKSWDPKKARLLAPRNGNDAEAPSKPEPLPYIVIVVDELADLMKQVGKEVEESIVRLAQKARAAGIHIVVATQRPSTDVITGLIKSNFPSRVAFQVRSRTDSRIILDANGAETLLGRGDMLYLPAGVPALQRVHGAFVDDDEVRRIAEHLRTQGVPRYDAEIRIEDPAESGGLGEDEYDEYYDIAVKIVTEARKASTSMIQRHLKIGYNRAARIIEMMERDGVVGPADGARPREVLAPPHG